MAEVLFIVTSLARKPIRLPRKIWEEKSCVEHPELTRRHDYLGEAPKRPQYLCVVYRELNGEGFSICAGGLRRAG